MSNETDPERDSDVGSAETGPSGGYIQYPAALAQLQERLRAKPYEVAAWVFWGPEFGGLRAFRNGNEPRVVVRFEFDLAFEGSADYWNQVVSAWFLETDIQTFIPGMRFIAVGELCERWKERVPGSDPLSVIQSAIAASQLLPMEPPSGWSDQDGLGLHSPSGGSLFCLEHVEALEAEWGQPARHGGAAVEPAEMDAQKRGQVHASEAKRLGNGLRLIGALLQLLEKEYPKRESLLAAIEQSFGGVPGLSRSHLKSLFPAATRELDSARSPGSVRKNRVQLD